MFTWIFKLIKYDNIHDSYANMEISDYYKEEKNHNVLNGKSSKLNSTSL